MKKIFTLVLCALTVAVTAQEPDQEIKSKIKQVTVFLEGAQIKRQAQVSLKPGVSILNLTGISHRIDEQSIRAAATAGVKILSVSFRVDYLEEVKKPEKISALEHERRIILAQIAQEKSTQEVYREEEVILKTNKSIGGTAKGVEIEELKVAMDYFRLRLMDIKKTLLAIDQRIRDHNEALGRIEAQLKELSNIKIQPSGEITIKVSAKSFTQTDLAVDYMVLEARWFPSYDIRAKDIQSPVGVTYKANIAQQSGEDWENVKLTISSGNPAETGTRPQIRPWYLGFNNSTTNRQAAVIGTVQASDMYGSSTGSVRGRVVDGQGMGMPGVNVLIKGTTAGTVTDVEGYYSLTLTGDARTLVFSFVGYMAQEIPLNNQPVVDVSMVEEVSVLSEVVVTGYAEQQRRSVTGSVSTLSGRAYGVTAGTAPRVRKTITATPVVRQTNIEFTLDEPFTVKSDGELRTTDMVAYDLPAIFEYYCVPKLDDDAFLLAKVLSWDEYNFLEGEASLFFEGKYIGKSIMDTRNTNDTLSLSLGRDANVVVTREKIKDLSSRQLVGSNQKVIYAYEIVVRNKKAQPVTIVIDDQVPVPNTKEITVDLVEDSHGDYHADTGILNWKKQLDPGQTETIQMKYVVRYPKSSQMILE